MNSTTKLKPITIDFIPNSIFSFPRLGPTVLSSTNFIGAAKAPALKSNANSLASAGEPTPVILKLVPRTA